MIPVFWIVAETRRRGLIDFKVLKSATPKTVGRRILHLFFNTVLLVIGMVSSFYGLRMIFIAMSRIKEPWSSLIYVELIVVFVVFYVYLFNLLERKLDLKIANDIYSFMKTTRFYFFGLILVELSVPIFRLISIVFYGLDILY
jgi:hypothetical protein